MGGDLMTDPQTWADGLTTAALPSMSQLERADRCPPSETLVKVRKTSAAAEGGNVVHDYLASVGELGQEEALAKIPEAMRQVCAVLPLARLPVDPKAYTPEVAFAYDPITRRARVLGSNIGRDYAAHGLKVGYEIPGSADVVGLTDDSVIVLDYKSGTSVRAAPRENWQLLGLAAAAASAFNKPNAHVGLIYLPPSGQPRYDEADLDAFDLEDVRDRLIDLARRVVSARIAQAAGNVWKLTFNPGDWCRYCPGMNTCPATVSMLQAALATTGDTAIAVFNRAITDGDLVPVFQQYKRAADVIERLGEQLKGWAGSNPITMPDGKVYGPQLRAEREPTDKARGELMAWIDDTLKHKVPDDDARAAYVRDWTDSAFNYSTGIGRLDAVAKDVADFMGWKIAPTQRSLFDHLKAKGAVAVNTTTSVALHRPKVEKKPA